MNGVRQGWLVAKRELRERSRSRAFLASLAIMVIAVVGVIALPTLLDTSAEPRTWASPAPPPRRSPQTITAQGNAVGTKIRIHHYDTVTDGEQAVRDGKVDVLIVDANKLEWRRRADEQLKALATAAIQISAVQDAPKPAGITDTQLGAPPGPGHREQCRARTSRGAVA